MRKKMISKNRKKIMRKLYLKMKKKRIKVKIFKFNIKYYIH